MRVPSALLRAPRGQTEARGGPQRLDIGPADEPSPPANCTRARARYAAFCLAGADAAMPGTREARRRT
jgi:hypothetical protein